MNNILLLAAPGGANLQTAATVAEPPASIFDRYADSVIGCYARHYDAVEVHGVRNFASGTGDGTCYEIDNLTPTSFSIYVHLKDGGLDCVGDFGKYDDAVQYGAQVSAEYGWPVRNHVLDAHRITSFATLQ
jgi:hypothetical protein